MSVTLFHFVVSMIGDMLAYPCSPVMLLALLPIALIPMILSQCTRIWHMGTMYSNTADIGDNKINPLLTLSAVQLSRRIQDKEDPLTSSQLLELCIEQIYRLNPYLNAVGATRFQQARIEAAAIDEAIASDALTNPSPLTGVPVVIKECFEFPDFPYTNGLCGRRHRIGEVTCPAIAQVQQRGVIVLAATNTSEACMWHESINPIYGATNNPYDFRRSAGGSSGGCGAAVAACLAPIAVTSDVGGSTRIPALYNGLFGHKPTGGAISNLNTAPTVGTGGVNQYCQLGPTSRHAEDLWPLLRALLKTDSPVIMQGTSRLPKIDYSKLTVYECRHSLTHPLLASSPHPDIIASISRTSDHLRSLGATILNLDDVIELRDAFSGLNAFRIWGAMMAAGRHEPFAQTIREGLSGPLLAPWEFIKSIFNLSHHTTPAVLLAMVESLVELVPSNNADMIAMGERLKAALHKVLSCSEVKPEDSEDLITHETVILMPSLPTHAPFHSESFLRIFDTANTSFFNVMETPATAIPMGLSRDGLPIGAQIISGLGRDHVGITIATDLEKAGVAYWSPPLTKRGSLYK